MKSNYNDCLTRLLKDEGGYTNNPNDSGGPTNFGITLADYRNYINKAGTAANVKGMSIDEAKAIYKSKYWNAMGCDALPSGVDYTVFDYAVNSGLGRPQKALNRFKSITDPVKLIDAINDERTTFLKSIGTGKNSVFMKGWMARVQRVRNYSQYLAAHPKDNTGAVVGTGVTGAGIGFSQYWHQHETAIIIGAVLLAIAIGTAIHIYRNKAATAAVPKGK